MNSAKLLLLEDDAVAAEHILRGMSELGHDVAWIQRGSMAVEALLSEEFDVAIIDRMVPELDGLEVVRSARESGCSTPVLMLTALGGLEDRVEGLEQGADDYLTKPYAFSELSARVHALLRRPATLRPAEKLVSGDVEMDLLRREVRRAGRLIDIQPREFRVLELLMRNAGQVVTKSMLLEKVWRFDFDPRTSVVETLMSRLRAKLNEGFANDAIQTERGSGYSMQACE